VPSNVNFVPVDFERVSLATALSEARLDFEAAAFSSMLGVSQYLTEAALDETFKFILSMPAWSEIVFSFVAADAVLPPDNVALVNAFTSHAAAVGEPWLSRFVPGELAAKLKDMGFSNVFHLTAEEANRRYFQNRSDGLIASLLEQMMRATV
jgi:O-methyltransferase involved in polyketide biosynthesis